MLRTLRAASLSRRGAEDSRFWWPPRVAHVTGSRLPRESQHAPGHGGGRAGVVGAVRLAYARAPHHQLSSLCATRRHVPPPPPPALRSTAAGPVGSLRLPSSGPALAAPPVLLCCYSARRSVLRRPRVLPALRRPVHTDGTLAGPYRPAGRPRPGSAPDAHANCHAAQASRGLLALPPNPAPGSGAS